MEFIVAAAYPAATSPSFHATAMALLARRPSSHPANPRTSRRYFSIVPASRSSSRRCRSNASIRSSTIALSILLDLLNLCYLILHITGGSAMEYLAHPFNCPPLSHLSGRHPLQLALALPPPV